MQLFIFKVFFFGIMNKENRIFNLFPTIYFPYLNNTLLNVTNSNQNRKICLRYVLVDNLNDHKTDIDKEETMGWNLLF